MSDLNPEVQYSEIRRWIANEERLIADRWTWFVTPHTFFVAAFAISHNAEQPWGAIMACCVSCLGGLMAWEFPKSIDDAISTIAAWLAKEDAFFADNPDYASAFAIPNRPASWHINAWAILKEHHRYLRLFWPLAGAVSLLRLGVWFVATPGTAHWVLAGVIAIAALVLYFTCPQLRDWLTATFPRRVASDQPAEANDNGVSEEIR